MPEFEESSSAVSSGESSLFLKTIRHQDRFGEIVISDSLLPVFSSSSGFVQSIASAASLRPEEQPYPVSGMSVGSCV